MAVFHAHTRQIMIGSFTRKLDIMLDCILKQEPFRLSIHIGVEQSPIDPEHHQTYLKDVA